MSAGTIALASLSATTSTAKPAVAARTKLLLEGPILSTLLRLSAPNVLNLLAIAGMITFDGLFLGRLGADALAGVSLAFPFVMLIQHTADGRRRVVCHCPRARRRQARCGERARRSYLRTGFRPCGNVFGGAPVRRADHLSMDGRPRSNPVIRDGLRQHRVLRRSFHLLLNLLGSAVRGTGNKALPAFVIAGSVVAHIVISPLLIFGWGPFPALGPAGAGWGLMVSFGVGSIALLAYLRSSRSLVTLTFRGATLRWSLFADILKVGVPGLINVVITNLSVVLLTGIASHLGKETAVGYAMGARLEYILIQLAFGFGTSIVAMVGTNWGARQ
jgi:Na+-driven multidrug efflux pump